MTNRSQRVVRFGGLLIFSAAVLLILSRRADGPARLSGFGSALLVGLPVAGLGCLAAAVISPRLRDSVRANPFWYVAWGVVGLVVVCLLVSAVAATAKARDGH
jgi:hypothetical protein